MEDRSIGNSDYLALALQSGLINLALSYSSRRRQIYSHTLPLFIIIVTHIFQFE